MVDLACALLPGGIWVAVEHPCPGLPGRAIHLDPDRIGELGSIVGEDRREQIPERIGTDGRPDGVYGIAHAAGRIALPGECKHQVRIREVDGKEAAWGAGRSDHGIHLHHADLRVLPAESLPVLVSPSLKAMLVHLVGPRDALAPWLVHAPGKRQGADAHVMEGPLLDVSVQGAFGEAYGILPMAGDDLMDGKAAGEPVMQHPAYPLPLILGNGDAAP